MPSRKTSTPNMAPIKHKFSIALFIILFAAVGSYFVFSSYADDYLHNDFSAPPRGQDAIIPDFAGANWVDHGAGDTFTQTAYVSYNMERGPARQINLYFSYNPDYVKLLQVTCTTSWGCKKSNWNTHISGTHKGTGFVVCVDAPTGRYEGKLIYTMRMQALRNLDGGGGNGNPNDAWFVGLAGIAPGSCNSNPNGRNTQWSWLQGRCGTIGGTTYPGCYNGPDPGTATFNGFSPLTTRKRTTNSRSNVGDDNSNKNTGSGGGSSGGSTAKRPDDKPNSIPTSSKQGNVTKQPELEPSPFFDGKQYKSGSETDNVVMSTASDASETVARNWPYTVVTLALFGLGFGLYRLFWRK